MSSSIHKVLSNEVRDYLGQSNNYSSTTVFPITSLNTFSCYDDYYCNSASFAIAGFIFLGIIGLGLTILGLVLNVLLIPVLSLVGIRSSATYYMIGLAISDNCLLLINVMLIIIRYLPGRSEAAQIYAYKSLVAHLVPFGTPMKILCQTLTIALCACLILDRIIYCRSHKKYDTAKRAVALKVITTVVTLIIVCKLPNFLIYKIVENAQSLTTVRWTLLAKSWIFILDLSIFVVVYVIVVVSTIVLWGMVITCHFSSNSYDKKLDKLHPTEKFHRREKIYVLVVLMIGLATVVLKFPQLLSNIFFGFSTKRNEAQMQRLSFFVMCTDCLDFALIVIKPGIYLLFAAHLRRALKDMVGLLFTPSQYTLLQASGGMGKWVNVTSSEQSETSNSLLQCHNSEKSLSKIDFVALAANRLMKSGTTSNYVEAVFPGTAGESLILENSSNYNKYLGS